MGDRLRGAGPDLGGCERGQLVERAASDAEWHADQRDAREGEEGQAPQRTVVARRLEERTGRQLLGHRHGLGDDVVAAGGAQPHHVPVVDDLAGRRGEPRQAPVGPALGDHPRGVAVEDEAAHGEPLGVSAPARERPASRHRVPARIDRHEPTDGREHRRRREIGVGAEGLPRHRGLQPRRERRSTGTDGGRPAGRAVGPAQLLDQLHERQRLELETAQRPGLQGAEQPRASEAVDQVDGHGAGAFGLAGPSRHLVGERPDGRTKVGGSVVRRGAVERVGRHGVVLNRVQWVVSDTGVCIE